MTMLEKVKEPKSQVGPSSSIANKAWLNDLLAVRRRQRQWTYEPAHRRMERTLLSAKVLEAESDVLLNEEMVVFQSLDPSVLLKDTMSPSYALNPPPQGKLGSVHPS